MNLEICKIICEKGCAFLSFAKIFSNTYSQNSQKHLDSTKKSTTDALITATKKRIQKTVEATGDFIGNKIVDKITSVSMKSSTKELHSNENELEILKERCIFHEKRQ